MSQRKTKKTIRLFDMKLSSAAKKEVNNVMASGWLSTGSRVAAFEKELSKLLNVPYVAAVSSGTAALHLALEAYGDLKNTEIITTPFTFVATVEAIIMAGARVVLADINSDTLNISAEAAARKIRKKTKAIVPVDIAGLPADYSALKKLCKAHALKLISDSAHALGSKYQSKTMPELADVSVYSFYPTKNVTTAEGGAVASKNKKLIEKVRLLSRHGLSSNAFQRQKSGGWGYDVPAFGYKANMSDIHAALGIGELKNFEKNQQKRAKLAGRYLQNLIQLSDFIKLPPAAAEICHSWHLFIIQLNLKRLTIDRNKVIAEMTKLGVQCGVHYQPIFELSYYRQALNLKARDFPNTAKAGKAVVSLPLHTLLTMSDIDYVCECLSGILGRNRC
ncbi:MAG: DegT/DnrJ/EryC1/StrS aminotransferase family protein [candidate division Zixibacteria bacterium]|nr:DegT/DnrJ/EryC1/StrS aminotransferase family protein [candidate division Zixibacteria bacterium]